MGMDEAADRAPGPQPALPGRAARRERYLACLAELSTRLLQAPDPGVVLDLAVGSLREASGADRCYVFENHARGSGGVCTTLRAEACGSGVAALRRASGDDRRAPRGLRAPRARPGRAALRRRPRLPRGGAARPRARGHPFRRAAPDPGGGRVVGNAGPRCLSAGTGLRGGRRGAAAHRRQRDRRRSRAGAQGRGAPRQREALPRHPGPGLRPDRRARRAGPLPLREPEPRGGVRSAAGATGRAQRLRARPPRRPPTGGPDLPGDDPGWRRHGRLPHAPRGRKLALGRVHRALLRRR